MKPHRFLSVYFWKVAGNHEYCMSGQTGSRDINLEGSLAAYEFPHWEWKHHKTGNLMLSVRSSFVLNLYLVAPVM